MTLTISSPVTLCCTECATGYYVQTGDDHGTCPVCRHSVVPSADVARYLDAGERLVWVDDVTGRGPRVLAYFAEECTGDDDDA